MALSFFLKFLIQLVLVLVVLDSTNAESLSLGFYEKTCPGLEALVRRTVARYVAQDKTVGASLLRLHFHDCFVRGCDGSVLLNSTENNQAEKDAETNLTLRSFSVIDAVKEAVEKACPMIVSCADILALAARDGVSLLAWDFWVGSGNLWEVQTGRRDGNLSLASEATAKLPPADGDITTLKAIFQGVGLDSRDLVILSGAHTIGISHCISFHNRLYNFTGKGDADPSLDPNYAMRLRGKCKPEDLGPIVEMDPGSYKTFDTNYYKLVAKRRGLFHSDAALLEDEDTRGYVYARLNSSNSDFFYEFGESMMKMGRIGVLTGKDGEIRRHCAVING